MGESIPKSFSETDRHGQAEYHPKTPLGRRLLALRKQAIAKGMRLLSWGEVNEEVRLRRGERPDDT